MTSRGCSSPRGQSKQRTDYKETFTFYQELLKVWQEVHSFHPINASHIKSESLWNNVFILDIRGPIPVNPKWADKGIWSLGCLIEEGNFLSHCQVSEKYGVECTFLDMLSIRQKLPMSWKEASALDAPPCSKGETEIYLNMADNYSLCIDKMNAKLMYWNIIDKQDCTLTAVQK